LEKSYVPVHPAFEHHGMMALGKGGLFVRISSKTEQGLGHMSLAEAIEM
jgi:hypothetical protein